jgi:hypothetical protein
MVINMKYEILDGENQVINVIVADQDFVEEHYRGRYKELVEPPEIVEARLTAEAGAKAAEVRAQRDTLLAASDWTQVADAPVDKAAWATYRQALRDIPQQGGFPATITWPVKP